MSASDPQQLVDSLRRYLADRNLKFTQPRQDILLAFFDCDGHVSAEEIHRKVKGVNPDVGLATVHRTLKILVDGGFAEEHTFGGRHRRYERSLTREHHDHLICQDCGHIFEFEEPRIEELQQEVARRFGFTISHHRLELFGVCDASQRGEVCPHREARKGKKRPT